MFGFWYHFRGRDEIELPARADVTFFRNSRSVSAGVGDHDYPVRNIANAQSENIQSQNLQIKYESNNNKINDSLLVTQTYLEISGTEFHFAVLIFLYEKRSPAACLRKKGLRQDLNL